MSHLLQTENPPRGPYVGPVCISDKPHWARLRFGGASHRWHVIVGLMALCGQQRFDYPVAPGSPCEPPIVLGGHR